MTDERIQAAQDLGFEVFFGWVTEAGRKVVAAQNHHAPAPE